MKRNIITASLLFLIFCNIFSPIVASNHHIYAANRDAGKFVAITFDDGPHPIYTEKILDILEKNNAKATFFVIGENVERYPEIAIKIHEAGHEIGNHTYSHPDMSCISVDRAIEEIIHAENVITDTTGTKPVLFRSPGGIYSDSLVDAVVKHDYKPILWSWRQDTRDWNHEPADKIVSGVIKNIQNGDIILFHDYNTNGSPTPTAIERLLPKLKKMGYSFVTVSELMELNEMR